MTETSYLPGPEAAMQGNGDVHSPRVSIWTRVLLFSLAYFLGAHFGDWLTFKPSNFNTFWPPSGLLVAILLLNPTRYWPAFLLAVYPANLAFDLMHGRPLWVTLIFCTGNCAEGLVGAFLLRRLFGKSFSLTSIREYIGLILLSALLSTTVSATIGTATVVQAFGGEPFDTWTRWWMGDVTGVLIIAPLLLSWIPGLPSLFSRLRSIVVGALFLLFVVLLTVLCFRWQSPLYMGMNFLLLPIFGIIAIRFGLQGISLAGLICAVFAVACLRHDADALAATNRSQLWQVVYLQGFLCVTVGASSLFALLYQERRRLEERVRQSEKMEAIGQLAAGIAHDFNNQLAGVMGYADMLVQQARDEKHREYARNIVASALKSADLTKQLLAFGRRGKYLSEPIDLHRILVDAVSLLEHSIDKRIRIHLVLEATSHMIVGDPSQIHNAILNIAINARDAMPEGGDLTFWTSVADLDESTCQSLPDEITPGSYLRIKTTDTGCGMDKETLKRIFEPFYTTKPVGQGTGMGLASVYGTIRNHQGTITVESEAQQGSAFTIYLPLSPEGSQAPDKTVKHTPIQGKANILMADDEEIVLELGTDMLEDLGYRVTACRDGEEATAIYQRQWQEIDLVILDMVMPGMSGRDTFQALRRINPDVRAILSSGYSIEGEAQAILDEGVLGFIGKPFQLVELSEKVAAALSEEIHVDNVPPAASQ